MSRSDEARQRAIRRLEQFKDSREPRHEIIWGLLGDAEGTVAVSGQAGKVWVRLLGGDSNLVRAWNAAVPLVATLRVDVEVERQEGMPDDYTVLGVSKVAYGGYDNNTRFYIVPHHETHEYTPGGEGYDIVNVYTRSLTELRADEQSTPDMTVQISDGFYYTATQMVLRNADNSPTFSAAPAAGLVRYDLLYLDTTNSVYKIREGLEVPPEFSSRPMPLADDLPIAWIWFQSGDTEITNSMIIDARVYLMPIGVLSAETHPFDPQAASSKHTGTLAGLHAHVVNENRTNMCDGSRTVFPTEHEYCPESLQVYLNGQLLTLDDDYTEETTYYDTFTMATAPVAGDAFTISYVPQFV